MLTKEQVLQETIEQWEHVVATGQKLHMPSYYNNCPCCEYVAQLTGMGIDCYSDCPLKGLWPQGCTSSDSPYERWVSTGNPKYAQEIVNYAKSQLKVELKVGDLVTISNTEGLVSLSSLYQNRFAAPTLPASTTYKIVAIDSRVSCDRNVLIRTTDQAQRTFLHTLKYLKKFKRSQYKKNQLVRVDEMRLRYFADYDEKSAGIYCYPHGATSFTYSGSLVYWGNHRPLTPQEIEDL